MPCILIVKYHQFGEICCLCHEGRRALNYLVLYPVHVHDVFIKEAVSQNNSVVYTILVRLSTTFPPAVRRGQMAQYEDGRRTAT
jgi:hypothetical protein